MPKAQQGRSYNLPKYQFACHEGLHDPKVCSRIVISASAPTSSTPFRPKPQSPRRILGQTRMASLDENPDHSMKFRSATSWFNVLPARNVPQSYDKPR